MKSGKIFFKRIVSAFVISALLPLGTALASETNENPVTEVNLEDYLITAERIPTNKWDTPANVAVITAEEIEANHYQDLAEALSHVNGVAISVPNNVILNGNWNVLLLIDGQRVGLDEGIGNGRGVDLRNVPSMKSIERIEIIKGGGSALYGSDSVGGVLNIITKKGKRNETTIDLNTGSWNKQNAEITNQGADGTFSWFITGGVHGSKPYDYRKSDKNDFDAGMTRDDYLDKTFSVRLDNHFDDRNSITLNIAHRHHQYDNTSSVSGSHYGKYIYNNAALIYNFKEGTSTPGFFRIFNNDEKVLTNIRGEYGLYTDNYLRRRGLDYQNGWELGKNHKLIAGLEWYQTELSNEWRSRIYAPFYDGFNALTTNTAVYVQDTISIGEKWTVVPGVRLDHHSTFGNHWSPKIAANYRADEKTKFYASWGRTFKAPHMYGLYEPLYGNKNLRPQAGHTETIGFEHDFDEKTNIELNFFNTKLSDVVAIDTESNRYVNMAYTEKQRGAEIFFRKNIDDRWSYDLGYSHTHITRYSNFVYPQPNGYRVGIRYRQGPWKANLLCVAASSVDTRFNNSYSAGSFGSRKYAVLDFNASYDVTDHTTVYLKFNNITNQDYAYGGSETHAPGRFLQFGVECRF